MRGSLPILALVLTLSAVAVRGEETAPEPANVKTGLRGTVGSGGYVGRGAYLQFGDVWRIKGSYSDYRFDGSTGTTRTASLRGAYQGINLAAGITVSVTPRNDSYANRAFSADAGWTFILDEDKEANAGLSELELGGFWTQTRHSQIVPGTPVLPQERNLVINQHDLGLSAALTGWDVTLSADFFRTIYDQDFDGLPAAALRRPRLGETASLVNGFPDRGGSVRLDYEGWNALVPYISLAVTRYKIQPQPASLTSSLGATLKHGGFGLDLSYERVRQKGSPDSKYFNFSGSYKF